MFARRGQVRSVAASEEAPPVGVGYRALRLLDAQGLEHTAANFSVARLCVSDPGGMIAMAVDAVLMEGRRLGQPDVDRILAAERRRDAGRSSSEEDPGQAALRHRTLELASLTADAASASSTFGADLAVGLGQMEEGSDRMEMVVRAMVERTRAVEAELRSASSRIEELRQQVDSSREDAQRDALTGLLNRRGALRELDSLGSSKGVVAVCDVDHFKSVNDRFGHGVGDRVLKGVAASLVESAGVHTVARWGGEEFLIILDGVDLAGAGAILERARTDLDARSFRVRGTEEPLGAVTISIGAASMLGVGAERAVESADRLLYQAKRSGRNQVALPLGGR